MSFVDDEHRMYFILTGELEDSVFDLPAAIGAAVGWCDVESIGDEAKQVGGTAGGVCDVGEAVGVFREARYEGAEQR